MSKLEFMVGPPGTGKTSTFITSKYTELLNNFNYKRIIVLSHTNVAADEIRDEFWKIQEPYLKKNNPKAYELKKELFTKDNYKNPKLRGLAIMGKLLQMGIFEKKGKSKYTLTDRGRKFIQVFG